MGFKVTRLKCTKDVYFPDIDLLGNAIMSLVWKEGCYFGENNFEPLLHSLV